MKTPFIAVEVAGALMTE